MPDIRKCVNEFQELQDFYKEGGRVRILFNQKLKQKLWHFPQFSIFKIWVLAKWHNFFISRGFYLFSNLITDYTFHYTFLKYLRKIDEEQESKLSNEFFSQTDQNVAIEENNMDFGPDFIEEVLGVKNSRNLRNSSQIPLTAMEVTRSQEKMSMGSVLRFVVCILSPNHCLSLKAFPSKYHNEICLETSCLQVHI